MDHIMHNLSKFQTPSILSYTNGVVKACGAEALRDFEERQENVAYWFKVTVYPTMMNHSPFDSETDL